MTLTYFERKAAANLFWALPTFLFHHHEGWKFILMDFFPTFKVEFAVYIA